MRPVVLDVRHDPDGYYVIAVDDRDGEELFYCWPSRHPSIEAAVHAACDELAPDQRVVGTLDVKEEP